MDPFDHKKRFKAGDQEQEGPADPYGTDYVDGEQSENGFPSDELEEFRAADWKKEFPDYDADSWEEKAPYRGPLRLFAPVASCLTGTLLGAAIAGALVNRVPAARQGRMFLIYFLVLAPLVSFVWHWFFHMLPERLAKKVSDKLANRIGSEPIHPK